MFTLRPYQNSAVEAGVNFFTTDTSYDGALMILPTGSGKSLVIASIAKQLDGNCIILQPSKEILEQNYAKLQAYGVDYCTIYSASLNSKQIGKMTLATIGSVIKQKHLFQDFKYIIIDECHLVDHTGGQYQEFIRHIGCKVLGLTATPYRLRQYGMGSMLKFLTRVRNPVFQEVIHYTQIADIDCLGFLADMKYYEIKAINPEKLELNSTGMDYTDKSMKTHFAEVNLDEKIIDVIKRVIKAGRKHILLFTKFVEDAQRISDALRSAGIVATHVSGETGEKEREDILADFKDGKIQVVANVGVLTTGFDFPELDCVILARPTRSLALYYQMVGRGMRPHKDKPDCWVIDMSETKQRFGEVRDLVIGTDGGKFSKKRVIKSGWKTLTNVFIK